ncbi:hypothetical protein BTM25_52450 [Actinomadura rubteroloni]|uniref:DUF1772 domain-containing protein n=1 Tax=Actinomadura rubteroloni TaxID=1926885 RepID=A0A2P4UDB5_9ACTN|nr:hypothetical protein [Actinomadura rubteroloni]POM23039.1 hypothetical protein BTM25_52450 [Actinomadura rubteroloni]
MRPALQRRLTLTAVIGLAYWLFGNLYEAVVFSPNWVNDSPDQFRRINAFFSTTGPTLYFVPLTILPLVLLWFLWWRNQDPALAPDYRRAGIAAVLLAALNALIVSTVIPHMFGSDALSHPGNLNTAAWEWNILNVVRMILTATTASFGFAAFRKLDRHSTGHPGDAAS